MGLELIPVVPTELSFFPSTLFFVFVGLLFGNGLASPSPSLILLEFVAAVADVWDFAFPEMNQNHMYH